MRKPLLAALTLLMAGCGQAPMLEIPTSQGPVTPASRTTSAPSASPAPSPAVASSSAAPSTSPSSSTAQLDPIALSTKTLAGLASYTCNEQVYGKKNGVAVGLTLAVSWMAPSNLRLDVQSTNLSQTKGSVLVFDGGSQVTLKDPALPFFMQTVNLSVDDPRLQDGFGNRFDQATWASVIANLADPQAQVSRIGTANVLGHEAIAYQVQSPKLTASGLQVEQIGLDPSDGKPLFIQQLDASGVASQIVFSSYSFDSVTDPSVFRL